MKTKKKNSIIGAILILIIGIVLLWYNEGRTVKTNKAITEAKKEYVDVSSEKVDPKNNNHLVATTGKLNASQEGLTDSIFNIHVNSVKLVRTVEIYQWDEDCETDDEGYERCTYKKVWSEDIIDSTIFNEQGHENPTTVPYESETFLDTNAKLGAFSLNQSLLTQLSASKTVTELDANIATALGMEIVNNNYTNVKNNAPEIGNIRINFRSNDTDTASVLAVQTEDGFEPFTASSGYKINELREGSHTGAEILQLLTSENNMLKWILRLVGTLLIIFGVAAIVEPIRRLASFIPMLGSIFGWISGLASIAVGLAISLLVIALAWLRYRPVVSILLIIGAILLFVVMKKWKGNKASKASPAEPMNTESQNQDPMTNTQPMTEQYNQSSMTNAQPMTEQLNQLPPMNNQPVSEVSIPSTVSQSEDNPTQII